MSFAHLLSILLLASSTLAKTVTYDFSVTWTKGNPDGQYERKVIGINGQWPIPQIDVDLGDRLVINFHNGLPDQDSSLHFHGLFQNGTTFMDGPAMVSQCPVPPGMNITYDFIVRASSGIDLRRFQININDIRLINQEPIGTTPTSKANTPTEFAGPS